jgi:hypothetical protein
MNEAELDRRLGHLLRQPEQTADQVFIDQVVALARLDRDIRRARRRSFRKALIECSGGVAVALTFFLLSQAQVAPPDGMLTLQGPATAGLAMLALWALVSLPLSANVKRTA